jgi:hypothetical protein
MQKEEIVKPFSTIKKIYDPSYFNFANGFAEYTGIWDLQLAHQWFENPKTVLSREEDQSTKLHSLFYKWFNNSSVKMTYIFFLLFRIQPYLCQKDEPLVYQKVPTFRVNFPNNKAVGEWHTDRKYNHNLAAFNIFFPFTDAFGSNTIWMAKENTSRKSKNKYQFKTINAKYGEFVIWDGVNTLHGNGINLTGYTRLSMDFRVIPYSQFEEEENAYSINTKKKFAIGDYYELLDPKEFTLFREIPKVM